MTTVNGSVPPVARPEAIGGAEDVGTVTGCSCWVLQFGWLPRSRTVAKAGTKLAGELAKVVVGRSAVEAEPATGGSRIRPGPRIPRTTG